MITDTEDAVAWYEIKNIESVDSPALIIFEDRVVENIHRLISMIDDVNRLRPHVKTHKTKEAAILMLKAGISKFKCATIAEAEMLAIVRAPDVLFAYQPAGPKLTRFLELIIKYPDTTFSCLVDNFETATNISTAALEERLVVDVYIDINIGMNRTGVSAGYQAVKLYKKCFFLQGIKLLGLHAYDGHIREVDFEKRTAICNSVFTSVEETQKILADAGLPKPIVIAGGTPTFPIHAKRREVECSPGTFIFWDAGYQRLCKEQAFLPAALVISRIISLPEKNIICLDLGHKSIASENELANRVVFLNATNLKFVGHSEEHLVAEVPESHSYAVGSVLYGLPVHICPTVALYERALVVKNHQVAAEWQIIARDRKINV